MTAATPESTRGASPAAKRRPPFPVKTFWLLLGLVALTVVWALPSPDGLPVVGQRALGILVFAVIVWVSEAVPYPISALLIAAFIAFGVGFAPMPGDESTGLFGTSEGVRLAMGGLASPANTLVLSALMLAAAMQATQLHRRLALLVLRMMGDKTSSVLIGAILVATLLAFFVPSATARAGAVIPILVGMIAAFGLAKESRLGALLVITAVHAVSIWNVGIKTAAAQNLVGAGFISQELGVDIEWGRWFIIAAPWSVVMSIALYFIMRLIIKPEVERIEGGRETVRAQLSEMGPITLNEKKLIGFSVTLLGFWASEGRLHDVDSTTITLAAVALMLVPGIGVMQWKQVQGLVDWGTVLVFGIGISLGTVLLSSGGAAWLSDQTFGRLGLDQYPLLVTIAVVAAFSIIIHLGFASATSLASALMPVVIALTVTLGLSQQQSVGFALIQQFVISIGFLLPISSPQGMLGYGTGTFTVKDYFKAGLPLTVLGYLLVLLFSATYWQWIGVL